VRHVDASGEAGKEAHETGFPCPDTARCRAAAWPRRKSAPGLSPSHARIHHLKTACRDDKIGLEWASSPVLLKIASATPGMNVLATVLIT
jgi:hypothetical protein